MKNDVLVDSNVYIALLKTKKDAVQVLFDWAEDRNLAICGMVRLEVLRGIKSLKLLTKISAFMDVLCKIPSDNRLWSDAAELAWNLDRKGIVIPGPDLVIAASALRSGSAVMTSDAHFSHIEGLRVIAPPADWFA